MTGVELTAVWLFGIFCAAVTVSSAIKSRCTARIETARLQAEAQVSAMRALAEAQHGPMTVPPAWMKDGGL